MADLTLLYYTANTIENKVPGGHVADRIRENLLAVTDGKIPTLSVSQKPMNLGTNICVGNIGRSHLNVYRQILIGSKAAKTKYVAMAEDDILYSLVSYDDDPEWFKENEEWGKSDYHQVYLVEDYDQAEIENTHWSVALIDHKPLLRRLTEIKRLVNQADYLIIHDTEPECDKFFKYSRIYPLFKYRFGYTRCRPHTTISSNFFDPKNLYP